jgi:hypothetical protein
MEGIGGSQPELPQRHELREGYSGKKKLTKKAQRSKEQVREDLLSNSGLTMPGTPGGNEQE